MSEFTEKEAHSKRCCVDAGKNCSASECMGWRWIYGNPHDSESKGGILLPRELWPGYCGRAGHPKSVAVAVSA